MSPRSANPRTPAQRTAASKARLIAAGGRIVMVRLTRAGATALDRHMAAAASATTQGQIIERLLIATMKSL